MLPSGPKEEEEEEESRSRSITYALKLAYKSQFSYLYKSCSSKKQTLTSSGNQETPRNKSVASRPLRRPASEMVEKE